jgi:hypothetical protein
LAESKSKRVLWKKYKINVMEEEEVERGFDSDIKRKPKNQV